MKTPDNQRLVWADLYRGLAVLVMIETHVVNTFLATAVRSSEWFAYLNYGNGLVAPSFLFVAGFMMGLDRGKPERPGYFFRRARQILLLAGIGYGLHFPWKELREQRWSEAWLVGTQVDVLPCMAAGLGAMLALGWLTRNRDGDRGRGDAVWWLGVVVLLLLTVFFSPSAAQWKGLPVPLQAWINRDTGSWFPLFPWAGFAFVGGLAGAAYGLAERKMPADQRWAAMLQPLRRVSARRWAGYFSVPIPLALAVWAFHGSDHSPSSPASFCERVAWVFILWAGSEWLAARMRPALLIFAGRHSLFLYVSHLFLISTLVGWGVPTQAFHVTGAAGLLLLVGGVSLGLAQAWHKGWSALRWVSLPRDAASLPVS